MSTMSGALQDQHTVPLVATKVREYNKEASPASERGSHSRTLSVNERPIGLDESQ